MTNRLAELVAITGWRQRTGGGHRHLPKPYHLVAAREHGRHDTREGAVTQQHFKAWPRRAS
jgi:hypothetical protein